MGLRTQRNIFEKLALKSDNVQSFNTTSDETIISRKVQPDVFILENLFFGQHEKSEQLKSLVSLYTQGTVQKTGITSVAQIGKDGQAVPRAQNS